MLATPGNVRGLFVGADDDVARNGRCYDTALMSLGRTMTWQETTAVFFDVTRTCPGCPGVSGAAEFQTQTMFVMSYRTLHNAADRARRVRLRRTAAAQNEPLADEQQRVLDTPAPHTPSHQHAAQQQLEQQRQRKWLSAFDRKWGFQPPDRKAAWESACELRFEGRRCFKAQRRWPLFLK